MQLSPKAVKLRKLEELTNSKKKHSEKLTLILECSVAVNGALKSV